MSFFQALSLQIQGGGWVNIPLLTLAAGLFYLLGYRFSLLKSSINLNPYDVFYGRSNKASIVKDANLELSKIKGHGQNHKKVEELMIHIQKITGSYASITTTLVTLAPLLGLLGTVIGMIETFSSLGDQSLFSSSGGIAGGISQALITTQVGLVIAVPGLLISRFLNRIQKETLMSVEQLIEMHKLKEGESH